MCLDPQLCGFLLQLLSRTMDMNNANIAKNNISNIKVESSILKSVTKHLSRHGHL